MIIITSSFAITFGVLFAYVSLILSTQNPLLILSGVTFAGIFFEIGFGSLYFLKYVLITYREMIPYYLQIISKEDDMDLINYEVKILLRRLSRGFFKSREERNAIKTAVAFILFVERTTMLDTSLRKKIMRDVLSILHKQTYTELVHAISRYDSKIESTCRTRYNNLKKYICAEYDLDSFEIFKFLKAYTREESGKSVKRVGISLTWIEEHKFAVVVLIAALYIVIFFLMNKYSPDSSGTVIVNNITNTVLNKPILSWFT